MNHDSRLIAWKKSRQGAALNTHTRQTHCCLYKSTLTVSMIHDSQKAEILNFLCRHHWTKRSRGDRDVKSESHDNRRLRVIDFYFFSLHSAAWKVAVPSLVSGALITSYHPSYEGLLIRSLDCQDWCRISFSNVITSFAQPVRDSIGGWPLRSNIVFSMSLARGSCSSYLL